MKYLLLYLFKRPVRRNGKRERNVKRQKYLKNNVRKFFRIRVMKPPIERLYEEPNRTDNRVTHTQK